MGGVEFPVPGSEQLREELLRRWGEPHRHYHDRRHLSEVLAALPDDAPRAVRLAAWYHDAVYDPTRDDNEEASARLAREQLHALVSDESFAELHAFARRAGIPGRAFERDHYDVPAERHAALIASGAVPVRARELVARLSAAGLRRPKGRPAP